MGFYERGGVRIHFEEAGSGFPLLVITGGGLNSTIAGLAGTGSPFNPMEAFKADYRCIASDLRNADRSSFMASRQHLIEKYNPEAYQLSHSEV